MQDSYLQSRRGGEDIQFQSDHQHPCPSTEEKMRMTVCFGQRIFTENLIWSTFTRMILSFSRLSSMPSISAMILVALLYTTFYPTILYGVYVAHQRYHLVFFLPVSFFVKKCKDILKRKSFSFKPTCIQFFFTLSFGSICVHLSHLLLFQEHLQHRNPNLA